MNSHSVVIRDLKKNYLNYSDLEVIRIENSFSTGMPDLIIQIPGRTIYIEIKHYRDNLSKTQHIWWRRALQLNQKCFIVTYAWREVGGKYSYGLFLPHSPSKKSWGDCLWSSDKSVVDELKHILFNE